jgi:hypothetical protein
MSSHDNLLSKVYSLTDDEATEIATETYIDASAVVQSEVHRRGHSTCFEHCALRA